MKTQNIKLTSKNYTPPTTNMLAFCLAENTLGL